ncbi:DUF305 domain-containing protein [Phormidesmis priestleyi ULC007]|uniref:DUF305 domain-containing protein n=1 Tax=Phormidesmis priestleyi ULC007 TaxID=1920490 RepID=A0A2T1D3K0_9CYAN|nr:DUF305 domain-containing protein [Phormidesmis priestleyi]PSB15060.1 DUF305 domain-containing protein [Phormidesmis priestleyi ULC007]
MSHNFFARTGFLALTLGAIATSSFLNACSTSVQNQAQAPSPAATDAGSMQSMDHSNMNGMNHGSMSMDLGPADAEIDLRFVDAMTPHHQGAVEMAKEAQQKSKRPEIQKLAAGILKAQDKEINQMKQWRQAWYPKASAEPVAYNSKMGHSMPMSQDQMKGMMMNMDLGAADAQFDLRFLNAMIPHHEGAVVMAQDASSKSKRPEIKKLAQEIIASQKTEIKQMQQWKQAWYGK